jgi:hypothetical protein
MSTDFYLPSSGPIFPKELVVCAGQLLPAILKEKKKYISYSTKEAISKKNIFFLWKKASSERSGNK